MGNRDKEIGSMGSLTMQRIDNPLDFENTETCPNCGQYVGNDSTCPNCGAVLFEEDELNLFDEDADME